PAGSKITLCRWRAEGLMRPRTSNGRRSVRRRRRINGKRRARLVSVHRRAVPLTTQIDRRANAPGTNEPALSTPMGKIIHAVAGSEGGSRPDCVEEPCGRRGEDEGGGVKGCLRDWHPRSGGGDCLRAGDELGEFPEVLSGSRQVEFVAGAARAAQ